MAQFETIQPLFVLSGFFVGFLVGMTGVGGGSLMTPLLILLFHVQPVTAVGTDLIYASVTKTGGSLVHGFNKTIDWRIVRRLAAGSIPASLLTLLILWLLKIDPTAYSLVVTKVLGAALILTAMALIFRKRLLATYSRRVGLLSEENTRFYTILTGLILGVLVTISSVGAGALGVTALVFLYPQLAAIRIVGSDLAHAVPLTLIAGLAHWWLGSVDWTLLFTLLVGSLPGIFVGSHLANRIPDRVLRPTLAGILLLVAGKLISA